MMLLTFLTVLKIIGIILLSVISLLILILLLVLFIPVKYKALGNLDSNEGSSLKAAAFVSWFLGIVKAEYKYIENDRGLCIRVFGIRLKSREEKENRRRRREERKALKKNKKREKKERRGSKTKVEYTLTQYDESDEGFREETLNPKGSPKSINEEVRLKHDDRDIEMPYDGHADNNTGGSDTDSNGLYEKITGSLLKLKNKISAIYYKARSIYKNLNAKAEDAAYYIDALSNDAVNRQALSYLIKKTRALLKSIRPRKLKGHVDYGADDPADTGRVLAIAAAAYPLYAPGLKVNPDFENKVLAFDITLKGRIYIVVLVKTLAALYFNKKVKRLIRIMKKENGNGR